MSQSKFNLQYIIVVDFESTCWDVRSTSTPPPEIIEFPAVLINLQTGKIEDQFQQYVMPTEVKKLSDFCTNFTGNKIFKPIFWDAELILFIIKE